MYLLAVRVKVICFNTSFLCLQDMNQLKCSSRNEAGYEHRNEELVQNSAPAKRNVLLENSKADL